MTPATNVLIAVDGSDDSVRAATVAAQLFADDATFVFVHVAEAIPMTPPDRMPFSAAGMAPAIPPEVGADDPGGEHEVRDSARSVALSVATSAGLDAAETIGLIGDPAREIVATAQERGADVIVLAAHERGWLAELFTTSITDDIQHMATIPVLVVPPIRSHPA